MSTESIKLRIFDAAQSLFAEGGEADVSMRRIAKSVGVTPMAIYKHYAGKNAILNALMADGFAAWEARVSKIQERDPVRWLERLIEAFLEFALAEPRRFDAAFLLNANEARQYPDDFAKGRSPVMAHAYQRIDEARASGNFESATTPEIGLAIAALAQGLVSMHRAGRFNSEKAFRAAYRRALSHCISSYGKEPRK